MHLVEIVNTATSSGLCALCKFYDYFGQWIILWLSRLHVGSLNTLHYITFPVKMRINRKNLCAVSMHVHTMIGTCYCSQWSCFPCLHRRVWSWSHVQRLCYNTFLRITMVCRKRSIENRKRDEQSCVHEESLASSSNIMVTITCMQPLVPQLWVSHARSRN